MNDDILELFKQTTSFDLKQYLIDSQEFISRERLSIIAYYSGEIEFLDTNVFEKFNILKFQDERVFELFRIHKKQFPSTIELWDLISLLEKIRKVFKSTLNSPRWSRSSINEFGISNSFEIPHLIRRKESLKTIAKKTDRKWNDLAKDNRLREEDYTAEGGEVISLKIPINNRNLIVESVVDLMVDENIRGKDMNIFLNYDSDKKDIGVLSPKETILQSVQILAGLKKNQNPLYPNDGLNKETIVATNTSLLNFPIFTRQLVANFNTDDSLKNFNVTNIEKDQDNLVVSFSVESRDSETLEPFKHTY